MAQQFLAGQQVGPVAVVEHRDAIEDQAANPRIGDGHLHRDQRAGVRAVEVELVGRQGRQRLVDDGREVGDGERIGTIGRVGVTVAGGVDRDHGPARGQAPHQRLQQGRRGRRGVEHHEGPPRAGDASRQQLAVPGRHVAAIDDAGHRTRPPGLECTVGARGRRRRATASRRCGSGAAGRSITLPTAPGGGSPASRGPTGSRGGDGVAEGDPGDALGMREPCGPKGSPATVTSVCGTSMRASEEAAERANAAWSPAS